MKIKKLLILSLLLVLPGCSNNDITYQYTLYENEITIEGLSDEAKSSLESFTIPSFINNYPVTKIGSRAFKNSVIKELKFEDNCQLKEISQEAFAEMTNLTSIILPSSIEAIGVDAFWDCYNLTNIDFSACDKLVYIADTAFYEDSNLKEISLPASLERLGEEAFYCCTNLTKITFGENIKTIEFHAFDGCSLLKIYFNGNPDMEKFSAEWNYDSFSSAYLPYFLPNQ